MTEQNVNFPQTADLTINSEIDLDGESVPVQLSATLTLNADGTITDEGGTGITGTWQQTPLPVPPSNTSPPVVSGTAQVGDTLSCSEGEWLGDEPMTFAYQWARAGEQIANATASSYTLEVADVGEAVDCTVTVTNDGGSVTVVTEAVGPVVAPPAPLKSLVGATLGTLDIPTAKAWDAMMLSGLSQTKMAQAVQKVYLGANVLPGAVTSQDKAFAAQGGAILQSIKPPTSPSAATDAAFQKTLEAYLACYGASNYRIVLWQEDDLPKDNFTPASYKAYVAHYTPLIRAVAPELVVVWDPGSYQASGYPLTTAFYPGDEYVDHIVCDVYGDSNYAAQVPPIAALADAHANGPIPFGIGEFNSSATNTDITHAQWTAFYRWIISFFEARLAAGKPSSWILLYASGVNVPLEAISAGDYRIPGIQQVVSRLSAPQGGELA